MSVNVTNHLNFRGDARAALKFYQSVFGGDLTIVTYKDAHNVQSPSEADQVMWGQVAAKNGFRVMAYDVPSRMPWDQGTNAFFVSVRGDSAAEISERSVRRHVGPGCRDGVQGVLSLEHG
jgi:PhnB protein